jgi:hypothetical protein
MAREEKKSKWATVKLASLMSRKLSKLQREKLKVLTDAVERHHLKGRLWILLVVWIHSFMLLNRLQMAMSSRS